MFHPLAHGRNENITDGYNGLIIPVKNTHTLKNAMEKILIDERLYQKPKTIGSESIEPYEQHIIRQALLGEYLK